MNESGILTWRTDDQSDVPASLGKVSEQFMNMTRNNRSIQSGSLGIYYENMKSPIDTKL